MRPVRSDAATGVTRQGRVRRRSALAASVVAAAFAIALQRPAFPQAPPKPDSSIPRPAADPFGRDSPRGLVSGLVSALGAEDYARAANYLDVSGVPPAGRPAAGAAYARRLKILLDGGGRLTAVLRVSDQAAGRLNDGLAADQERVGSLPAGPADPVPIIATRTTEAGSTVWRVSRATLASMRNAPAGAAWRSTLPPALARATLLGAPVVDWLVLLALGGVIFGAVRLAFSAGLYVLGRFRRDPNAGHLAHLVDAVAAPLSLVLTVALFLSVAARAGVSFLARVLVEQFIGGVLVVAVLWLLWRVVDAGSEIAVERMDHHQRRRAKSAILFARRAAKLLLVAVAVIAVLATVGVNVTAGLAALGIGGIALALGAQKTIENVVGGVSVIADELVRVGDFCRIGDVTGTVEEIGIRSTRIRTSERTRVSIPNGNLAGMQVENYAMRDRFLFNPTLALASTLDTDGVERALEAVRAAFASAGFVRDGARANFRGFSGSALEVETFAYLATADADEAAALRERLLLDIMRRVTATGGAFFSPVSVDVTNGS